MSATGNPMKARLRSDVEIGMLLMAFAMLLIPGIDAIAKLLSGTVSPAQIAWGRFVFQTLLLLPVILLTGRPVRSARLGVHACRGALIATAIVLLFWALRYLPIANAIAIFFVEPLILTLFSALFLRESVGARRLVAVAVGLLGAMIVIRPSWEAFGWAAVLPLGTAICFAGYLTLTRHVAGNEDVLTIQLWAGIFAALVLSAVLMMGGATGVEVIAPAWPTAWELGMLGALGLIATVGHVLIALALRHASASILAPFQYLEIFSATVLGFVLFGDFPDAVTWLGTSIIVASGLYVFLRERRLARDSVRGIEAP